MATITYLERGRVLSIPAQSGDSLLSALQGAGITALDAPCGGNGTCGKCLVRVSGDVEPPSDDERSRLPEGDGLRLACRCIVQGNCTVSPADAISGAVVASEGQALSFPLSPREGLGAAVDIGTTTVVLYLYDRSNGQRLALRSGQNRQRSFGADVISRVNHANTSEGGLDQMTVAIQEQLSGYLQECCAEAGQDLEEVREIAVAGNTIMEHIFAGLSPASIAVAPFTPLSLFGSRAGGAACGLPGSVYLFPCVAGYVGGDITAGLLASGAYRSERPVLFLDIGTNGEMGIGSRDGFLTCATAAGPAFEGAEIVCGMSGSDGAVNRVWLEEGQLRFSVLGGGAPRGICGSGLVDALAVLLELGAVDETGRLLPPDEAEDHVLPYLEETEDGVRFYLDPEQTVYLTDGDVRKLQLAKAAIAAGVQTLLSKAGLTENDVAALYLAGGFGNYIDQNSAAAIGLLPAALLDRIIPVGNSAGMGAVAWLLSDQARSELEAFQPKCSYLELSGCPEFNEAYIECMMFE